MRRAIVIPMLSAIAKRGNLLVLARNQGSVRIQVLDLSRREWVREFAFQPDSGASVDVGGLAVGEDGRIFLADTGACCVWIFNLFGKPLGRLGLPKEASTPRDRRGIPAFPRGLGLDSLERLWVACGEPSWVHGLQVYSREGRYQMSVPSRGVRTETFSAPEGVSIQGERVWIAEPLADRLQVFRADGSFFGSYDVEERAAVGRPFAIVPYGDGQAILVREPQEELVLLDREMRPRSSGSLRATDRMDGPTGLLGMEDGSLLILDQLGERLRRLDPESGLVDWIRP